MTTQNTNAPNYTAIKEKQQQMWASGDYAKVGTTLQITGESLCEAMDIRSGRSVLDVAAGNGNVTLAAARRYCKVTSTDYVQALLDQSQARALAEGLAVDYQQADAENLPFDASQFDYVVSTFGVMFAPNQIQSAAELLRVCKSGGKIGLANWTPDSFIGRLFKIVGKYVAPPAGVNSLALWGTGSFIRDNFGAHATNIEIHKRQFSFRYLSADHWIEVFRTYYGPTHKAFNTLSGDVQVSFANDIRALIGELNAADDGTLVVKSDYLEVVITKSQV
jgi:ubiquinone/menaquinone biosynthesis C-methylase UbiE